MKKYLFVFIVMLFIFPFGISAEEDVYDIVLFFGQSNMVGIDKNFSETVIDEDVGFEFRYDCGDVNHNSCLQSIKDKYYFSTNGDVQAKYGEYLKYNPDNKTLSLVPVADSSDKKSYSLQESKGASVIPAFAKTYYEKTGRKIIAVMAANGGRPISQFMPQDTNYYIYQGMKMKYNAAVEYAEKNNYNIGKKFYVVFQGETDASLLDSSKTYTSEKYYSRFKTVHDSLKKDCGIQFGAIIETGQELGSGKDNGVMELHKAQEKLIDENDDIMLASNYPYLAYKNNTTSAMKNGDLIHFSASSLDIVGKESAINVAHSIYFFNVKSDFGAKGDGVTDDSEAILDAINTCNGIDYCTILFPQGTYIVSGPIYIRKSNIELVGENKNNSIIKLVLNNVQTEKTESNVAILDENMVGVINIKPLKSDVQNVTINKLTIDVNSNGLIHESLGRGISIVRQPRDGKTHTVYSLNNINITNCQVKNAYSYGILVAGLRLAKGWNSKDSEDINKYTNNIKVIVESVNKGLKTCEIKKNATESKKIDISTLEKINNALIKEGFSEDLLKKYGDYINGNWDLRLFYDFYDVENVFIDNCMIFNSGAIGIRLNGVNNVDVSYNKVDNSKKENITVQGREVTVYHNYLGSRGGGCGNICVDRADNVLISNNSVDDTASNITKSNAGICQNSSAGPSYNVSIINNSIYNSKRGIWLKNHLKEINPHDKNDVGSLAGAGFMIHSNSYYNITSEDIRVDNLLNTRVDNGIKVGNSCIGEGNNISISYNNDDKQTFNINSSPLNYLNLKNSCYVNPSSIKIHYEGKMTVGGVQQLTATIIPENAVDKKIKWTSSDNNVLSISSNGRVIAKKIGTAKITASTSNNVSESITISVSNSSSKSSIKSVSIANKKDLKNMLTGDIKKLSINISPSDIYDNKDLTFESSNKKVLKVDSEGNISAVGSGKATITVTSFNNKKDSVDIVVKDANIELNSQKITLREGEEFELRANVKINGGSKKTQWGASSSNNVTLSNKKNDSVTVYAKKTGNLNVTASVGSEKAKATVKVIETKNDYSLNCPIITYDTSTVDNIHFAVKIDSSIQKYEIYTSSNKRSGSNAKWKFSIGDLTSSSSFSYPYSDVQAKIVVYGKKGTSRTCYTAPFDIEGKKLSDTKISTTLSATCPTFEMTNNMKYISGVKSYTVNFDGKGKTITGVSKVSLKVNTVKSKNYQYVWLYNDNGVTNKVGLYTHWNLGKNFNDDMVINFSILKNNPLDYQALVLVIDDKGDIQSCYSDRFNSLQLEKKEIISGTTDVYMEKGYSYNSSDMITYLKSIPNKYYATPNILFLKDQTYNLLVHEDGCGAVNMGSMMTYISDGSDCPYDYIKYTILHELGHSLDSMYYKIKGVYLSNSNDVKNAINTYSKNKQTSYMRVYSYTNLSEFYADLFAINYLNNSDFKNSYKNKWLLDDNLKKIINSSNNKSNIIFNKYNYDWHKYKNMYRNAK